MAGFNGQKNVIAMVAMQCITASVTLFSKAALSRGLSPLVFVVYRQTVATIIMAPLAFFSRWRSPDNALFGLKSFSLILLTSIIGVTVNNNTYFVGLNLSSPTIATAMLNLIPAITFVMAACVGMEKINPRNFRSMAKIIGTIICIGGGVCMALFKGPELFVRTKVAAGTILNNSKHTENLPLGCLFLFLNCCCNSFWIVMQVPITKACPEHLYTTFWMFFFSSIQSFLVTLIFVRNFQAWLLHSSLQVGSALVAAIGEALSFFIQVWCISQTGPVFAVMFTPLSTMIATIIAIVFLHQNIYLGSLIGAIGVVLGLYVVIWGKAKDLADLKQHQHGDDDEHRIQSVEINVRHQVSTDNRASPT